MTDRGETGAGELFAAIEHGDIDRVREIVASRPHLSVANNAQGISAVLDARYRDHTDILEVLLETGPRLDVFEAAAVGRVDRLAEIIAADPSSVGGWSVDGFTPLHLAAFFGHVTAVRLLLAAGADPGAVSRNPMLVMPLHSATAGRRTHAVVALLDGGAPVNERTHLGYTPIMEAAQNRDVPTATALLRAGADPLLANDAGKSAVELADESGVEELARLVRDAAERSADRRSALEGEEDRAGHDEDGATHPQ